MEVIKPIFIVGTGRCGSTAFHKLLGAHPQLMWLSGFAEEFPYRLSWNRWAVTAQGNPLIKRVFGSRIKPGEFYGFWYKHAYGFAEPGRDLVASDVTPRVKKQVRKAFEEMLSPKRNRMLIKLTGLVADRVPEGDLPRRQVHPHRARRAGGLQFLSAHQRVAVARVVRPVQLALRPPVARGPGGVGGERPVVRGAGRSAVADSHPGDREGPCGGRSSAVPGDEVRDLLRAHHRAIREVVEFAELERSPKFERHVAASPIRDTDRWRKDLSVEQQALLTNLLRDDLIRYGYDAT